MSEKKALVVLGATIALSLLGAAAAAVGSDRERGHEPYVVPCSLDGVNPAHHPEIFGNPAVARSYGFVQGPDRVWRVDSNCRRH